MKTRDVFLYVECLNDEDNAVDETFETSSILESVSSDEIRGETKIFEEMYWTYIDDEIFVSTKKIADDTDFIRSCWSCCISASVPKPARRPPPDQVRQSSLVQLNQSKYQQHY